MVPLFRTLAVAAGTFLLAGCVSSPPTSAPIAENHPANPDAHESPVPDQSQTLAVNSLATPPQMTNMPRTSVMHHHGTGEMPRVNQATPATRPGENAALSATRFTPSTSPATAPAGYICPMHKQVTAAQPGKCPICHMNLVPNKQGDKPDHAEHGVQQ